jgi:hypothetical protein
MIADVIVIGAVALAVAFSVAWLVRPALRRQIEAPKHAFERQVRQYDRVCQEARERRGEATNERE